MQDRATSWLDDQLDADTRWQPGPTWDRDELADEADALLDAASTPPAPPHADPELSASWLDDLELDAMEAVQHPIEVTADDLDAAAVRAAPFDDAPLSADDAVDDSSDDVVDVVPSSGVVDPFDVLVDAETPVRAPAMSEPLDDDVAPRTALASGSGEPDDVGDEFAPDAVAVDPMSAMPPLGTATDSARLDAFEFQPDVDPQPWSPDDEPDHAADDGLDAEPTTDDGGDLL